MPRCFKTLHYVGNKFPKILLWEEMWIFFISLNAPLQTTKQIRLKCSPQITGFQAKAGRGLWQQTMIDSLEEEERRQWADCSPDRLQSGHLVRCRGEKAEAEICSTGTSFKTPLKAVFLCRVRTQSGLRLNRRPGNGFKNIWGWIMNPKNNSPRRPRWRICIDHRDAHRPDFFLWRREKWEIKPNLLAALPDWIYLISCAHV